MVKHEMEWTMLWFRNQADLWRERSEREDADLTPGHKSYATKQQKLWTSFHSRSSERFKLYL